MTVSIIFTAYRESAKPYLDLAVRSAQGLMGSFEREVIVVAPESYSCDYEGVKRVTPGREYGMPHGLNAGIAAASGEYMFVCNDDVILTRSSVLNLMRVASEPQLGLVMPYGNDTNLGRYMLGTPVPPGPYKHTDYQPGFWSMLMEFDSPYPDGLIFADTLCLYAFMIRREVFEKVGPFDENLIGQDDIDYSLRVRQAGYQNAILLSAYVAHAGGASNTLSDEQRAESMRIFNEKWGAKVRGLNDE